MSGWPNVRVDELFPPCTKDDCTNKKHPHHHILPPQQELLESNEKLVALVGGFGSSKTLGACVMCHNLSVAVPGNMGIVLRRSLPKLHDSTERIYLEVLQRSGVNFQPRESRDGWPHRVIYPNGSEVYFRETKDLGRFLGPEYGWFFLDEAQEEPEKTFRDLRSRLRLPRASKYLRGILATNPPSNQHWIAKMFPQPGSWKKTVTLKGGKRETTSYRMIRSSTYDNPFLASAYIADLLQSHSPSEVRRIVEGHYGFAMEGNPVYPMFDFIKHVSDPELLHMTLVRAWDFGFHCPAVLWSQIYRCKFGQLHLVVLNELEVADIEAEPLAEKVLAETSRVFPDHPSRLILDGGDAAGAALNDKGPGPIIRLSRPRSDGGFGLTFRYRKFPDIDPGLDAVRKLLRTKCKCGFYLLTIHRRCRWLIEALAGGYHYPQEKPGKEQKPKPVKDGYYDNVADSLRYATMLFYEPAVLGEDQMVDLPGTYVDQTPWSWMNP